MAHSFLDTSALAKRYHAELGSAEIDGLWADATTTLFISRIGVVEAISVFAGKVRTGEITAAEFDVLRKRFLADVAQDRPNALRMRVAHLKDADRLIKKYGLERRLRTLDALQLAVALDARKRNLLERFVCSDRRLLNTARDEGMPVFDPENP